MVTRVVNLYKESYDWYIGRRNIRAFGMSTTFGMNGYYGNPFPLEAGASEQERIECLNKYREYFYKRLSEEPLFKTNVEFLRDKILGCYCKPKLCHGDVIAEYLNATPVPTLV